MVSKVTRVVAGMATQPGRASTARDVVRRLLPQVDTLVLHLDGFDTVPSWARHRRIEPAVHPDSSVAGAAGKLDCLHHARAGDKVLLIDDDVKVHRTTVRDLLKALERQGPGTVVGAHASLLPEQLRSYVRDRTVLRLDAAQDEDLDVDVLATCLCVFDAGTFDPDPMTWRYRNMVDLQFALAAKKAGVRLVSSARAENQFSFLDQMQPGSIYAGLLNDDSIQTVLAQELVASDF